jgi:predicted DNA binding CopG/RHH family protein
MKHTYLDKTEREIEKNAHLMVPVSEQKRIKIETILSRARKSRSISLRINSYDLNKLKEKAFQNGMPYQTLITTILHKYISDALYDKGEVFKVFKTLKKIPA